MIGAYADTNPSGATHGRLDDRVVQYMLDLATVAEAGRAPLQYFVLGETLRELPAALRELADRGHDLDQHTYSHLSLLAGDVDAVREEIATTNQLFAAALGALPQGLRGPGGYRTGLDDRPDVQEIIHEAGLGFVSCHYATKSPSGKYDVVADKNAYMMIKHLQPRRYANGLLEIPISGYSDRHWFDNLGRDLAGWIKHLQDCLDFAYDMGGLVYTPALHPDTHSRHDPGMAMLPDLLAYAGRKHEPVRFVTYREIAQAAAAPSEPA
jgi:peptidoglycan/xylan/chitin deacetylase (PgdA/CDA1 family)